MLYIPRGLGFGQEHGSTVNLAHGSVHGFAKDMEGIGAAEGATSGAKADEHSM